MSLPTGWCNPEEHKWLSDSAVGKDIIIELGVHLGRSTTALCSGGTIICCDNWAGRKAGRKEGRHKSFTKTFSAEIQSGKIVVRIVNLYNSKDLGRRQLLEDFIGTADMVYIDAGHNRRQVRGDIALARLLLKPDGLMCGHDLCDDLPGIQQALEDHSINYKREAGDIWSECKQGV